MPEVLGAQPVKSVAKLKLKASHLFIIDIPESELID